MTATRPPASLDEALALLRARRDEVRDRSGIELLGMVGSLARGEARPDSDIDVMVRQVGPTTLFTISRLERDLAEEIGRPVDLVFREALSPVRRAHIERDLVAL